ncbi:MAG: PEGA domain-containing protein [Deltaproteobacteria bacterium]|nr:MAG: PEGA domain-containing protein [Deltaproteobacteria bacterium]
MRRPLLLLAVLLTSMVSTDVRGQGDEAAKGEEAGGDQGAAEEDVYDEPVVDEAAERAKVHFQRGAALTKKARWGDALAAFEVAAKLRAHPVTTFNIGYCQRALGSYALARRTFRAALEQDLKGDDKLPATYLTRLQGYLGEIENLLARYDVTLQPAGAKLTVDGRPLAKEVEVAGGVPREVYVAGVLPAGHGSAMAGRFTLVLEPGAHVIKIERKGFAPALAKLDVQPGTAKPLTLQVDKLPAELKVRSTPDRAIVLLDGTDVGVTPLTLTRPGGKYRIDVELDGYEPYSTGVNLVAGQNADVEARLTEEETPITSTWWFWSAAGTVLVTGVVLTYALTRPDPEPEPYSGGGLGWVIAIP